MTENELMGHLILHLSLTVLVLGGMVLLMFLWFKKKVGNAKQAVIRKSKVAQCTQETEGTIMKIFRAGDGRNPTFVVDYKVGTKWYSTYDKMMMKIGEPYRFFNRPIGIQYKWAVRDFQVGAPIKVRYNPENPQQAYFPENYDGKYWTFS